MKFIMYKPTNVFINDMSGSAYVQALIAGILEASGCDVDYVESTDSNNYFLRDHFILTSLDGVVITSQKTKDIDTIVKTIVPTLPSMSNVVTIKSEFFGGNTFQVVREKTNTIYFADDGLGLMAAPSMFMPQRLDPTSIINGLNLLKRENPTLARTDFKGLALQTKDKDKKEIWQKYYQDLRKTPISSLKNDVNSVI